MEELSGELGKFRVVGALGQAGEEARCELWYKNGKMVGPQSGALGPPGTLCVLVPQKPEEGSQALHPITLPPGIKDKKRILDRKIHSQADSVLESKWEETLGRAEQQPLGANRDVRWGGRKTGPSIPFSESRWKGVGDSKRS